MDFKAYHKIRQFKDVVRTIITQANYEGKDAEGAPIYKENPKPTIKFIGTVKLHGTNAGITYTPEAGVRCQKRGSLLSPQKLDGHFGFNVFVLSERKEYFEDVMKNLWNKYCIPGEQIVVYGEWAGKGIQKGVAIAEAEKAFYLVDAEVWNPELEEVRWISIANWAVHPPKLFNIHSFLTFEIEIDFNKPQDSQNQLKEFTEAVEAHCPVGTALGIDGVGEGIVWTGFWEGRKYIFKVKGEKHSTSKVKTLAAVDPEVLESIDKFVHYACTENRMNQAIMETGAKEKKNMPDVLRWMANDILTEEIDTLTASGLEWKQVARQISNKVRSHFFEQLDRI